MGLETSEILFTRQRHDAKRAGLHYDIRLVHGDVAYSWATKKDMPKPGQAIILHQQPIHDTTYALSKRIEIPDGQYGAGVTTLDFVRKAKLVHNKDDGHFLMHTGDGEVFLLKHLPKFGEKQWLFKNISNTHPNYYKDESTEKKAEYSEGSESTFTHLGSTYTVDSALAKVKDAPVEKFPIAKLKWILKHLEIEPERLRKADYSHPIIVTSDKYRRLIPIDGAHRLTKAINEGQTTISGKFMSGLKGLEKVAEDNRFLTYIIKDAKEKESQSKAELRPHTLRALKKLEKQDGLLIDHSMGSGKTLLYLKAIENYQKKNPKDEALVMAPASLTTNIYKEIKKHGVKIDTSKLETLSYEKAAIDADRLRKKKFGIVVADEAHKLRNTDTKRHKELSDIITKAKKRLLGTGTAAYNHPADVAPLVNLVAGKNVLPEDKRFFEQRFIDKKLEQPPLLKRIIGHPPREIHKLKNVGELRAALRKHIDHYDLRDDPSAKDKFPEKHEVIKEVEMAPEQMALYKYMEGKLPWHLKMKVRMNLPLDKKDSAALNAFSTGVRQVSNSMNSYMPNYNKTTPKIEAAVRSLVESMKKDKNFKGLVYSNYLGSGLEDYSRELHKGGVPHAIYHGGLSKTQKDELLEAYNSGKLPVLLLSSSGTEGLNTKGTKKVQVLEPHFNKSKLDQVVSRAVRFESHEHLPREERKVEIEHYQSIIPKKKFHLGPTQYSIDQYLHNHSKHKNEISEEMKELVKEAKWFDRVDHAFVRAKYKEGHDWENLPNPVGSTKRDGAAFFMEIKEDGSPRYYSRRPSKHGGFPDRTANLLPELRDVKVPEFAGSVYHVELVHTGHEIGESVKDHHATLSGILNSKPPKAHATQIMEGPVRAVLLDVIEPKLHTFGDKLVHMEKLKESFNTPLLELSNTKIGKDAIAKLIEDTKAQKHEGVIVTSATLPETENIRVKIKHTDTYNLRVVSILQEIDILGVPKQSMGALVCADASGKIVANVGTGFTRKFREEVWKNPSIILGKDIQVKAMPTTNSRLRMPVYNGFADGDLDIVKEWSR